MVQEPRRRRFQFHLSTGVVLTLVAGGVIWMNLRTASAVGVAALGPVSKDTYNIYPVDSVGWPYGFLFRIDTASNGDVPSASTSTAKILSSPRAIQSFELTAFLDDLFIALLILALAFGAWEGVLRVRAFLAAEPEEVESGG